jgi:hypothetical protein
MLLRLAVSGGLFLLRAGAVSGDDADPRDKLMGKWHPAAAKDDSELWALENAGGENMRISHSLKQKTEAIECNIMGKDCEVKIAGHKAKVSIWFNGDTLVEMETRGPSQIVKRRFTFAGNDTLKLETMPIEPPGRTETAEFKRAGH